jgi:hypothetical protein
MRRIGEGEAEPAPSPLHQEQKAAIRRTIEGGLERSDITMVQGFSGPEPSNQGTDWLVKAKIYRGIPYKSTTYNENH